MQESILFGTATRLLDKWFRGDHHRVGPELRGLQVFDRSSIDCYGKQPTMEEIRTEKSEKYKELMNKRGTTEYDMWFLKYSPSKKHEKPDKTVYAKNREKGERQGKRERKTRKMQSKTNDYLV
jgi:hypothetical protein